MVSTQLLLCRVNTPVFPTELKNPYNAESISTLLIKTMKKFLLSLLAVILIFEEWLWDVLTAFGHALLERLHLGRIELWLMHVSPPIALTAFCIPLLIVTPINLVALGMLAKGMIIQGILLEIVAKLLGTMLIARVFALTKPQLMTYGMLRFVYETITHWLQWAHRKITETPVYRLATKLKALAKAKIKDWLPLMNIGKIIREALYTIRISANNKLDDKNH